MEMGDNPAARRKGGVSRIVPIFLIHIRAADHVASWPQGARQDRSLVIVRNGQLCPAAELYRYALAFNLI